MEYSISRDVTQQHLITTNVHVISISCQNISQQGWWKNQRIFRQLQPKNGHWLPLLGYMFSQLFCVPTLIPRRSTHGSGHLVVYATSALEEQTTPAFLKAPDGETKTGENVEPVICHLLEGFHLNKLGWVSKKGWGLFLLVVFLKCSHVLCGWEVIRINRSCLLLINQKLVGGFKYFLFSSLFREDSNFDYYFSDGLKPPTRKKFGFFNVSILFCWMLVLNVVFPIKSEVVCCKDATFFDRGPILGACLNPAKVGKFFYSCLWRDSYQPSLSTYIYILIYHVFIMSSLEEWITKS